MKRGIWVCICALVLFPVYSAGNDNMPKRKPITIAASTDGELINYQVQIDVTYDADMQADFSDVRFRANDARTILDFWLQEYTASTSATFWVKVPSIAATTGTTIYMYYNDTSAPGGSDIEATMLDGDDFSRANLNNASTWTKSSNNVLQSGSYGDPFVWYESGTLYVFVDDLASGDIRLLSNTLANFESTSWTDHGIILSRGAGGSWDDSTVRDVGVVKVGSTYYLYYAGADGTVGGHAIGLATASAITGTYTKDSGDGGRILTKTGGLNEPEVLYDGNSFIMTYTDGDSPSADDQGTGQIGLATSSDGITWADQGIIIDNVESHWQDQQTQIYNNQQYMFVNDANGNILVSVSRDGRYWGLPSTGAGLVRGAGGTYDDAAVYAPTIVKVGSTWYMYYQASDGTNQRLAAATATSLTSDKWWQSNTTFVITSNQLQKTGGAAGWSRSELRYYLVPPYTAEFHLNQSASTDTSYISGVYFGEDSSGNHYGVILDFTGTDTIALWRNDYPTPAGTSTVVATNTTYTLNTATDYRLRVTVTTSAISIDFWDGSWHTAILSEARTMQASAIGFYAFGTTTNNQFVSDFLFARQYAANEPTPSVGSEEDANDLPLLLSA